VFWFGKSNKDELSLLAEESVVAFLNGNIEADVLFVDFALKWQMKVDEHKNSGGDKDFLTLKKGEKTILYQFLEKRYKLINLFNKEFRRLCYEEKKFEPREYDFEHFRINNYFQSRYILTDPYELDAFIEQELSSYKDGVPKIKVEITKTKIRDAYESLLLSDDDENGILK